MLKVFSYGGGVQSNAALMLVAQNKLQYDHFIFANVGDECENRATLQYVRNVAMPFAEHHGIDLIEIKKRLRDGTNETLMSRIENSESSIPIPVRMSNGAPGNRSCTANFKSGVIYKWLRDHGVDKINKAVVGIGFSADELWRAEKLRPYVPSKKIHPINTIETPLIDLNLRRQDCLNIIRDAGLPQPEKSACWFCPFHRISEWQRLRREHPDLFEKACKLEAMLNERRRKLGKNNVWLTGFNRPLSEAIPLESGFLELNDECDDDVCDAGHCFT